MHGKTPPTMANYISPATVTGAFSALTAFFDWLKLAGGGAYQRFFDGANVGFCIVNLDGEFLRVNDCFAATLGYSKKELIGMKFMKFVLPEDRHSTMTTMQELREGAEVQGFKNRYERRDGKVVGLTWWSIVIGKEIFAVALEDDAKTG